MRGTTGTHVSPVVLLFDNSGDFCKIGGLQELFGLDEPIITLIDDCKHFSIRFWENRHCFLLF